MLEEKVKLIYNSAKSEMSAAIDSKSLYDLKVKFIGKSGELSLVMKEMGSLPKEDRPEFGKVVNKYKKELEAIYESCEQKLKNKELEEKLSSDTLDLTLPGPHQPVGSVHPIPLVIDEIVDILARLGYSVRTGPLIEKDWYNFEALNIPADHPARDEQDTFYMKPGYVLRTQTSPVQIHTLENEELPLRVLSPGSVFRSDSDISHSPNFHQIEGLLVDKKVSMADLKGTINFFVKEFFDSSIKIRFRPSFFPFTEPSAEVDCSCPICKSKGCRMCKNTGWIEIGGCGLVNPKVLKSANVDPEKWQGFAFGFGIERMAIIKYGVSDIRLFSDNNSFFLKQFV